ncbi:HEPN domain-containing protein [Candidatus Peregrinibacteria bacterium]|nr:HEPN domain-containing protein [Candidatus Peregrinibacteria bacterium]
MQNNYEEWLKKADEDERSIMAILKENGAPSTACFLSQQMAEKYLKALLLFHDKNFPKIHDLLELETLLLDKDPQIQTLHKQLEILNRYYIETRYPGDYPDFTFTEAKKAFEAAGHVKKIALTRLKFRNV